MSEIVLQVENLTKRYGSLTAVDDLNLSVFEGEVFGLLGPNGAGKTTSINMMCGLLRPDSGRVMIHGEQVRGGNVEVRVRVGVCPQQPILWEKLTCIEQLEFVGELYGMSRNAARQRGSDLLETLGLGDQRDRLAGVLSGGMQRRLNLALALVHDPQILVLDEPEAGLDPQSRLLVREYLRLLARQKTIILTTHNMDEAERLAERVAIIDQGRLLVLDTPEALKRTVGEGDVLEVEVDGLCLDDAQAAVASLVAESTSTDHTLLLKAYGMVEKIPMILEVLRKLGAMVGDVRLRASTLEDVFIALTGRRLRE